MGMRRVPFHYARYDEEVYVSQPPGFQDPKSPQKVYKVVKALYDYIKLRAVQFYVDDIIFGLKRSLGVRFELWMKDKYVDEILKKFDFENVKTASTPIETQKPLVKDEEASDVDAFCACSRFQVTPKTSHLTAVKRIFRYLKGKPKLGLWYPRESSFDLESYSVSDYAGANLDRKSTTGGTRTRREKDVDGQDSSVGLWLVYREVTTKIAQVVCAWIKSKNSLVKHFEDMRLSRKSKEYFQDENVSTDHVKLVPMGKVSTAKDTLETKYRQGYKYFGKNSYGINIYVYIKFTTPPAPTSEVPNESLPDSFSAQPSEEPFEQQPDPSPKTSPRPSPRPSPTHTIPDSIPEPTGENLEDHSSNDTSLSGNEDDMTLQNVYDLCISLCQQVSDQAKEIKLLKAKINKLKKQAKPVIKHHKAYLKTVSLQQRFPRKSFSKKHRVHKKNVSKQGRKIAKGESSVQRDPLFDVMPEDKIDHMETENAQSEGRTREMVDEDKEFDEVRLSTEDVVSTDKEGVSTDFEKVSTDRPIVSTDGSKVSTDEQVEGTEEHNEGTEEIFEGTEEQREGTEEKVESTAGQIKGTEDQTKEEIATQASQTSTQTPTSMIFGDLQFSSTRAYINKITSHIKPLPKIDPKDKGKKKMKKEMNLKSESDVSSSEKRSLSSFEMNREWLRKISRRVEAEEERNRIAEEKAANEELIRDFDDMKARIEADRLLAEKLQEQEREQFTIEEKELQFNQKHYCCKEVPCSTEIRSL
ncbi:hypothetical protein Tco_0533612 [Tanacetum coccineum]